MSQIYEWDSGTHTATVGCLFNYVSNPREMNSICFHIFSCYSNALHWCITVYRSWQNMAENTILCQLTICVLISELSIKLEKKCIC